MLASRCLCCGRGLRPGGSRTWAIVLFISCWVLFIIAEVCLLAGSVRNAYHTKYRSVLNSPPSCQTLRKGVFAAGAAFTVFTGIISELYYVSYSKASDFAHTHGGDTGLRMGNLWLLTLIPLQFLLMFFCTLCSITVYGIISSLRTNHEKGHLSLVLRN